ncbi:MAG TPA: FAD-dependent oxidoreductase [Chloroflexia bacterium]|nr:FAD-dependent oxidoreductase [Chloroflexia bacterium]
MGHSVKVYATVWCEDCKRVRKFLGEQKVHYDFVDIEREASGLFYIERLNKGKIIVPTLTIDSEVYPNPSNLELAEALGLQVKAARPFYELIIIGGGPAGLTAALFCAQEQISCLVIEGAGLGGQAGLTERLDNYPGFPEGLTGEEFAQRLVLQGKRFEIEMLSAQMVTNLDVDGRYKVVRTSNGDEYRTHAVLIATGSNYRRLNIPGEWELNGAGVHYCSTCDAPFYRDKEIIVVGGGNSAAEESLFLAKFASKVTMLVWKDTMTASKLVQQKVLEHPKIEVLYNTEARSFNGQGKLESVTVENNLTDDKYEIKADGVFIFIGLVPNAEFVTGKVSKDAGGFIITGPNLETSMQGVFAAGDVRSGNIKQVPTAAGEGTMAAFMIQRYLHTI